MAILPIRVFGDPVLRERARPIGPPTELHRALARNMIETMREAPGVGLAGPQVGVLERIFVWEVDDRHGALIDPVIESRSDQSVEAEEGCLSVPGLYYPVARATEVVVTGVEESGAPVRLEAEGLLARVCQHEIDHLDGILFIDRLPEELRGEALRQLREEMLGLPSKVPARREPEETL
ncbi:MAG: peptide deformylase [Actinomycetota bacterium]